MDKVITATAVISCAFALLLSAFVFGVSTGEAKRNKSTEYSYLVVPYNQTTLVPSGYELISQEGRAYVFRKEIK
jgi:hypothetical protein